MTPSQTERGEGLADTLPRSECRPNPPTLAERLIELRRRTRRSISAVAAAAGISRQHLWRIEKGLVPNPSPEILRRLASVYGVTLAQLLGYAAAGRAETLSRLLHCAEAICDEDWEALNNIARRVSTANS